MLSKHKQPNKNFAWRKKSKISTILLQDLCDPSMSKQDYVYDSVLWTCFVQTKKNWCLINSPTQGFINKWWFV